jgi:hypothetical protein
MKDSNWAGGGLCDLGFLSLQFRSRQQSMASHGYEPRGLGAKVLSRARLSDEIDHES